MPKDALGHGSNPRGAHAAGIEQIARFPHAPMPPMQVKKPVPAAAHANNVVALGNWAVNVKPEAFLAARDKSGRGQMFTPHQPGDLAHHRLFMNREGTIGAAISPEGDIQSVFNNSGVKGAGGSAIDEAIKRGGKTLDAFGPKLASIYAAHGFKETGRAKFDPAQAPPGWNTKRDGTPDVIFMKHGSRE